MAVPKLIYTISVCLKKILKILNNLLSFNEKKTLHIRYIPIGGVFFFMNKKEKIRIIRLLLKQYEKDKNILNSLNQANLYPSINYEDYYQTSSSSKEDYLLHRIQLKQELTKRIIFIEKISIYYW